MKIRQEGSNNNIFVTKRKSRGNEIAYALALLEGITLRGRSSSLVSQSRISTNIYTKGILIRGNKNINI